MEDNNKQNYETPGKDFIIKVSKVNVSIVWFC
jgi:hypothetical protein